MTDITKKVCPDQNFIIGIPPSANMQKAIDLVSFK